MVVVARLDLVPTAAVFGVAISLLIVVGIVGLTPLVAVGSCHGEVSTNLVTSIRSWITWSSLMAK